MSRLIPLLATCACLAAAQPAVAQSCKPAIPATTPTADFEFHNDGTVTHLPTDLTWQRCLVGQSLDDNGTPGDLADDRCKGTATSMTWQEALRHAEPQAEWRLPDIKELASIVERQCADPATNLAVFPDTPNSFVWSASADAGRAGSAWGVYLGGGNDFANNRDDDARVRLMRGGQ